MEPVPLGDDALSGKHFLVRVDDDGPRRAVGIEDDAAIRARRGVPTEVERQPVRPALAQHDGRKAGNDAALADRRLECGRRLAEEDDAREFGHAPFVDRGTVKPFSLDDQKTEPVKP